MHETGLVTAVQKIQRAKIAKTFRAQIDVRVLSSCVTFCLIVYTADFLFLGCLHSRPVSMTITPLTFLEHHLLFARGSRDFKGYVRPKKEISERNMCKRVIKTNFSEGFY